MLLVAVFYLASLASLAKSNCVDSFLQVGRPVKGLKTNTPLTWIEIDALCMQTFVGFKLLQDFKHLTDNEKNFCGGELVPFGVYEFNNKIYWAQSFGISMRMLAEDELLNMANTFPKPTYGNGAMDPTNGRWNLAEENVTYQCALCQAERSLNILHYPMHAVMEPPPSWHSRYDVKLVSVNATSEDVLTDEYKLALGREISKVLNVSENVFFRRFEVNDMKQLELHYRLDVYSLNESECHRVFPVWERFSMTLTDFSRCSEERVVGWEGVEEKLTPTLLGAIYVTMNETTEICSRWECIWNASADADKPTWSTPTYWDIQWKPCSEEQQYQNDDTFGHLLGARIHAKYVNRLKTLANSSVNELGLDEVVKITSLEMLRRNKISQDMSDEVVTILANVDLDGKESCMEEENRMHMIVVDLMGSENPVVGFALPLIDNTRVGSKHNVISNADYVTPELERTLTEAITDRSQFVATVSEKLVEKGRRLAFAVDLKDVSKDIKSWTYEKDKIHDIEVTIVLKLKDATTVLLLDDILFYVDITYQTLATRKNLTLTNTCTAWTRQTNWTSKGCTLLTPDAMVKRCRCKAKYFTINNGVLSGLYALKKNHVDAKRQSVFTYIAGNPNLMAAMIINAMLAVVSLAIIVVTAISYNIWIIDSAHKVILHTTLALTSSFASIVIASFVEFDTESAGCAALGVFRHYTLLAMFLWVLVMAGVQINEIMTKDSEKPATRSVLKFTLFAWGVPLAPIGLLLVSNPRLYRFDRFDRGYCYPEGVSFELTILAPAGFILLVTIGVFVVTAAHVFEFGSKMKKMRLSSLENLEQFRYLRRSVVVYLIFCLILALHFMSEMREARDSFLYEYLLLSIMIGLVSVIAILYVFLEENVFGFWRDSCKKLSFKITFSKNSPT